MSGLYEKNEIINFWIMIDSRIGRHDGKIIDVQKGINQYIYFVSIENHDRIRQVTEDAIRGYGDMSGVLGPTIDALTSL